MMKDSSGVLFFDHGALKPKRKAQSLSPQASRRLSICQEDRRFVLKEGLRIGTALRLRLCRGVSSMRPLETD